MMVQLVINVMNLAISLLSQQLSQHVPIYECGIVSHNWITGCMPKERILLNFLKIRGLFIAHKHSDRFGKDNTF